MVNPSSGAAAGYSGTPLVKKLGYKEGFRVWIFNAPNDYFELLGEMPDRTSMTGGEEGELDLVHLFATSLAECEAQVIASRTRIKRSGMIWVSWPKKASKVPTDITEDAIRSFALSHGLVDVKVCAVDHVWSGLKLVIPVALRG
ncbi:DUF3052 family protein [Cohnella sp. CFH 77786]|uniref:hypothetical protein n=1 Tax=Cohnella sp. CFH 77786 TaxID=2662265 RepID=UPI001C60BA81|nr:hypothetical protein [Cohnella sp. CFH 77786]MBW5448112.1 DUF3052 family protein [Cohnella sp. CFH 77786]